MDLIGHLLDYLRQLREMDDGSIIYEQRMEKVCKKLDEFLLDDNDDDDDDDDNDDTPPSGSDGAWRYTVEFMK